MNLATTSDGTNYQGRRLSRYRRWQARKRAELQRKGSRSARRRLARRKRKEQRHATHVNHRVSKEIVSVAQRTGRGIAVEALGGIRERVRLRRDQRGALSSWPFHQLGQHLAYKACKAGVPFLEVDMGLHLAALSALWAHRAGQPARPGPFSLSSVRARWPCRCRRWGQRARSRTLGVGVCHRTRTLLLTAAGVGCMRPVTVLS
ncbi:hypothetical protein GCM10010390_13790 [Streptomyces mordarskii]|uniref:Transposase n=1 Tax=Streptomyces mordarskii TaxID=1226758 RepID=A0ABN1C6K8_9ACTN